MDAKIIANYVLYISTDAFDDISNMKLNKLLYFAQGHCLQKYGKPLFSNVIEAWEHGPVIPDVYHLYKQYGDLPIKTYDIDMVNEVPSEIEDLLFDVVRKYGKYTASTLRNMTHVINSPWDQVYKGSHSHEVIPMRLIEDYFSEAEQLYSITKQFNDEDFIGYRDADGILVLPEEWNEHASNTGKRQDYPNQPVYGFGKF